MTNEDLKAALTPFLEQIKAHVKSTEREVYLTDVQVRLEFKGSAGDILKISSYAFNDRIEADSLTELVEKIKSHDPAEAARQKKHEEIDRLKAELAKLEESL